jgi:hypothetical protein
MRGRQNSFVMRHVAAELRETARRGEVQRSVDFVAEQDGLESRERWVVDLAFFR